MGVEGLAGLRQGSLTMAAPGLVLTVERVAELLGEDLDWLWDVAGEMEPEDGCLWGHGAGDQQTIAFTPDGLDRLKELVEHYKAAPHQLRRYESP